MTPQSDITNSCGCDSGHCHNDNEKSSFRIYAPLIVSFVLLTIGIVLDQLIANSFFNGIFRLVWYVIAYIPVAFPVLKSAFETTKEGDFFNEFSLMSIATIGAFCIGEYPEGVAVMLFYSVGELFQDRAVNKARNNIKELIDMRADIAMVLRNGSFIGLSPEEVEIGEKIQIKVGEKIPLDGILLTSDSSFDTSALTGESKPATYRQNEIVLAGMVNLGRVIEIEVRKAYKDSSLSRILALVEDATSRKAKTELMIRKFARIYTPIVFFLALGLATLPYFFVNEYIFSDWLYRALVFLVISCPCALVISVPLGYFGGIGAASRHGILFKGANYLDILNEVNTVVMDKTGTLTKGVFKVKEIVAENISHDDLIQIAKTVESQSLHPIARAISEYPSEIPVNFSDISDVEEIAGHGLKAKLKNRIILAGNSKLMRKFSVEYNPAIDTIVSSIVIFAVDNQYVGYITIADELKEDSTQLIDDLHKAGINKVIMLSGDKKEIVQETAKELHIDIALGDLLPEDKLKYVEKLKENPGNIIAFVGDGINDTPVLALSDVGIAMGAMGSDAAIEVADVVIQTDQPSKILTAMRISKATKRIIIQNITLALGIKILVLALGALGIANMWEAVFADVGVTVLAVLNSVRILKFK